MVYIQHRQLYGVYPAPSVSASVTSWCLRNDMEKFAFVILYMNIIFTAQQLFGGNSENLDFSRCVCTLSETLLTASKHVSTFFTVKIWRHFSIMSHPR